MKARRPVGVFVVGLASCLSFDHLSSDFAGSGLVDGGDVGQNADTGRLPDGGYRGFCSSGEPHVFCSDFDVGDLPLLWSDIGSDPLGTIALDTSMSVSAPRSLHTSLQASTSGFHLARASRFLKTPWRPTRLDFDMYVRRPAWGAGSGNVALFALSFAPSSTSEISVTFYLADGQGALTASLPTYTPFHADAPALDRWVHVRLEVAPDATNGVVSLLFDGASAGSRSGLAFDTAAAARAGAGINVSLGLARYNPTTPALDVFYDNVTLDFF